MSKNEMVSHLNTLSLSGKLKFIRDTPELTLVHDNGWFFVEYNNADFEDDSENGPEGFGELFTNSEEMDILLSMAGL
jgi:hypothetical protein